MSVVRHIDTDEFLTAAHAAIVRNPGASSFFRSFALGATRNPRLHL